jgi:hypothetical protein
MTLVLTEISQFGIAMAADSAVTETLQKSQKRFCVNNEI